jgi:Xaa-Pro dipeptidase
MHSRVEIVRQAMSRENLDLLVAIAPNNVRLLTGYWPVTGKSVALFGRERSWLILPKDEKCFAELSWVDEVHPFEPVSLSSLAPVQERLRPELKRIVAACEPLASVGLDEEMFSSPASYVATLALAGFPALINQILGPARVACRADLFARLRASLTGAERDLIFQAIRYAKSAFAAVPRLFKTGVREWELAGSLATLLGAGCTDTHRSGGSFFCASGQNSAQASAAYQQNTNRRIEANEVLLIHCNSYLDGIWTDITRTFYTGGQNKDYLRLMNILFRARNAALERIRPGARASEVDSGARHVLESEHIGKYFPHGTGHGVGFATIDPLALPRIHPVSEDILEEGMVFNVEPAVYLEGEFGLRHCDMVCVTAGGCEVMTDFLSSPDDLCLQNTNGV